MTPTKPSITVYVNIIKSIDPIGEKGAEGAANQVLLEEWGKDCEVSITFDGDEHLQDLNREFLGRDAPTDVIAFDLSRDGGDLVGDIYVSVDRAAEQAREHGVDFGEELLRLEVHGLLHIIGYDHTGDDGTMWKRQEKWVDRLYGKISE